VRNDRLQIKSSKKNLTKLEKDLVKFIGQYKYLFEACETAGNSYEDMI
jgi:hypothetical protein